MGTRNSGPSAGGGLRGAGWRLLCWPLRTGKVRGVRVSAQNPGPPAGDGCGTEGPPLLSTPPPQAGRAPGSAPPAGHLFPCAWPASWVDSPRCCLPGPSGPGKRPPWRVGARACCPPVWRAPGSGPGPRASLPPGCPAPGRRAGIAATPGLAATTPSLEANQTPHQPLDTQRTDSQVSLRSLICRSPCKHPRFARGARVPLSVQQGTWWAGIDHTPSELN